MPKRFLHGKIILSIYVAHDIDINVCIKET